MFGPDPAGDVVKVSPSGKRTVLGAGQLFFPSGFAFHNGGVYVSNWSIMPADNHGGPTGEVVRIATTDRRPPPPHHGRLAIPTSAPGRAPGAPTTCWGPL